MLLSVVPPVPKDLFSFVLALNSTPTQHYSLQTEDSTAMFRHIVQFLTAIPKQKKLFQHHPYNPGCLQSKWPALPGSNLIYFQWLRENYYVQNGEAADLPKKGKNKSKCIALKKQTTSRNRTFLHSSALSSLDIF